MLVNIYNCQRVSSIRNKSFVITKQSPLSLQEIYFIPDKRTLFKLRTAESILLTLKRLPFQPFSDNKVNKNPLLPKVASSAAGMPTADAINSEEAPWTLDKV
ncbi:hypothetical protein CEXT_700241 [Caerostris extrusa]|uniref:Uncharacterized protein n=1 Tax=Caerostris extrusa TaxID=172846 RepID=A0AAV4ULA1_CAEEX|nr:hypothetical protein CEXT_700241 [Caerostris extrusa]